MPSSTRYFGIGYFDFGDPLGTDFSGQIEIDRWVFIDKMIFGLMSIFGNGVINGWTVSAIESFTVSISEGFGNINFLAGRTTFPEELSDLPPNSTQYIYARIKERTSFTEEVDFLFDTSAILDETDFNFLKLAQVKVGATSIELIDNSVRKEIGFIELINAVIRLHRHRGGSLNPSKIDLASEVKGQLPSFRIADFDAEKVSTGTFELERMPLLDHQDLDNVGLLTHPQLDTFVKTIETSNKELFGEIGSANLLQLIIAAKLIYENPNSKLFTGEQIDENMVNEFAIIPGITPNDLIDFDNTTARVDLEQHVIEGVAPTTGTSFFVNFDTALAWKSQTRENLIISGDSITLAFDEEQESTTQIIEGFESSTESNQILNDTGPNLFTKQTVILVDNASVVSEASSTNVTEGFFAGEFAHSQTFRSQFVKQFSTAQDWSTFDSFILDIKCLSLIHGSVKMYFTSFSGEQSTDFVLLDVNEVTDDFEMRVIDLSIISFSDDIKSFVIYSDDLTNAFTYFIDNIHIQRALLLPEDGTLKVRYSAGASVVFAHAEWTSTEPLGTDIKVRARSANGTALLTRATFTNNLESGNVLNLKGTDIELEFTFTPDTDRLLAPILHSVRILVLTEAEIDGFSINTSEEFARGTNENTQINSSVINLDTPIYVDSLYFNLHDGMHQAFLNTSSDNSFIDSNGEPTIFGIKDSPISPNQVFKAVEDGLNSVTASLFEPKSVRRQIGRSFVIADTYNDRVLEFNEGGILVDGVGSVNYEANTLFPLAASVDIRTGILYVVWSRKISFKSVNVSKIVIQSNTQVVQLIKNFDKILGLTTEELDTVDAEGQIMPIFLSSQNAGLAQLLPSTDSFLQVDGSSTEGVVPGGIDILSKFYTTAATGLGIPCYVGNFAYIDGIFSPTWADRTSNKGLIIGNATIGIKEYNFPDGVTDNISRNTTISSIIEIDSSNNLVFGSNVMQFSPFIPGRIQELDSSTFLIGGIKPGGQSGNLTDPLNFRSLSGDDSTKQTQKEILNTLFFGNSNPYFGSVIVFDKNINSTTFRYTSPEGVLVSDVDLDTSGQFVVAESSLDRSGRIIKLDSNGNVVFSVGEGLYSLINDIAVQFDDSIIVST